MLPVFRRFFQDRNIAHDVTMRDAQRMEDACSDMFRAIAALPTSDSLVVTVPLIGARGRIKSHSGTSAFLSDPRDASLFTVTTFGPSGAPLIRYHAAPADGTWDGYRTGYVALSSVNVQTGELVATSNWNTINGLTNGDFIWLEEDIGKYSFIPHKLNRVPNGFALLSTDHGPATVWRSPHEMLDSSGSPIVGSTDFKKEATTMRVRSNRYCTATVLVL